MLQVHRMSVHWKSGACHTALSQRSLSNKCLCSCPWLLVLADWLQELTTCVLVHERATAWCPCLEKQFI